MRKYKENYEKRKEEILKDKGICKPNKAVIKEFLDWQEYKLCRINNIPKLDNNTYKTLLAYICRLRNLNKWVENKPFKKLTEKDIKKLYDGLETGAITTAAGKPVQDRKSYYSKLLKSKFGEMCGIKEISKKVLEFSKPNDSTVRFITEADLRKLVEVAISLKQKLLLWLLFDYGENVNSMLQLRKSDFFRDFDEESKRVVYRVNFRKEILKRSRTPRSELNNYEETSQFLDLILPKLQDNDLLFNFEYRQTLNFFKRAVGITGVKCQPYGDIPKLKDLRSGMACDLLNKHWTTDEVNARLGHKPSSAEIDKYVNFLAINKRKPRVKVYQHKLHKITEDLRESKQREALILRRLERVESLLNEVFENPEFQKSATEVYKCSF